MEHRVFVGLRAPQEMLGKVTEWREAHSDLGVRWLRDEDLHLTVIPPWKETDVAGAIESLRGISAHAFDVEFEHVGWGSTKFWPKLLWITGRDSPGFAALRRAVELTFGKLANSPFLPHVTIARVSKEDEAKTMPKVGERFEIAAEAAELVLFESLGHSRYEALATVKLV